MEIKLPERLNEFVQAKVKHGSYRDAADVVCQALRFWMASTATGANSPKRDSFAVFGTGSEDIEAIAFIVLMEASASAQQQRCSRQQWGARGAGSAQLFSRYGQRGGLSGRRHTGP
jgi:Arc/MetJ-type ribon-helix-helix transcriptional regulator